VLAHDIPDLFKLRPPELKYALGAVNRHGRLALRGRKSDPHRR
jgi:hypothetical protein